MPVASLTVNLRAQRIVTSTSPATKVLVTDYALPWHLVLEATSGGNVTAVRVRQRTHEDAPWSPWEAVTSGLPIASGSTLSLAERDRLAQALEIEVTAASAGVASLWLVGA